jgi:hypothetical protein
MVEITIEQDNIVFQVQGWDQLWSLRSRLDIPRRHIKGAHVDPEPAMGWFEGLKLAGTSIPHVFRAGSFYQKGNLVFWDVSDPAKTIVVELTDERYAKLIVEVAAPEEAVRLINNAITPSGA